MTGSAPKGEPEQLQAAADADNAATLAPTIDIIRKRPDFLAANAGARAARPSFVLLAHRRAETGAGDAARYGITVTKRIGNAVVRNRMKRRFRALLRDVLPSLARAGYDYVLIGRSPGVERDYALLEAELRSALDAIHSGKGDSRRKGASRRSRGKGDKGRIA